MGEGAIFDTRDAPPLHERRCVRYLPVAGSRHAEQREAIAAASRALYDRRSELCIDHSMGLTKLYNLMDEGGFADLAALHRSLDEAVAAAYGWPKSVAQDPEQIVSRLTALNREIVEGGRTYDPFAGAAADRAGELRAGTS